jgi:alpha-L-fucosidase
MRMGLYYSGGIDWTFDATVVRDITDLLVAVPRQPAYAAYAHRHWRELVERYEPAVLWNDIAYPAAANLPRLFADYYNRIPDGVINDRFFQSRIGGCRLLGAPPVRAALGRLAGWAMSHSVLRPPTGKHFDFRTPEYAPSYELTERKWEATRGIGHSFGYNQQEDPDTHLTVKDLVHSFIDIVSKNGNLLLNVGPKADGTIPDLQCERLRGLGAWVETNGEAIYATRPWVRAEGRTREGGRVRFTQRSRALYASVLATPQREAVTIEALRIPEDGTVHILGHSSPLDWRQDGHDLRVGLPEGLSDSVRGAPAYVLKIISQHRERKEEPEWST